MIQRVNEGESCEAASENFIFGCGQKRVGATANFPPSGGEDKANFFVETPGLPQNWHLWRSPPGVPSQSLRGGNLAIPNRSCLMTRKIQRFRPVRKRFRKHPLLRKFLTCQCWRELRSAICRVLLNPMKSMDVFPHCWVLGPRSRRKKIGSNLDVFGRQRSR